MSCVKMCLIQYVQHANNPQNTQEALRTTPGLREYQDTISLTRPLKEIYFVKTYPLDLQSVKLGNIDAIHTNEKDGQCTICS